MDETINRGPVTIFPDKPVARTDCNEAGDYAVHNVFSPTVLVSRPNLKAKTVHTCTHICQILDVAKP